MVRADSLTALVLALCMVQQVTAQAKLTFETVPTRGLEPSSFTIDWGSTIAFSANDRVFVHLPGFAGGYNAFGTKGAASGSGIASPIANGLKGNGVSDAFASAEWDDRTETIKVVVKSAHGAGTLKGLVLDKAFLSHGVGPLPPNGGIDSRWYKAAHVRKFSADLCSGGTSNRPGLGTERCMGKSTDVAFESASQTFTTTLPWLPTKPGIGAVGTFAPANVVYAAAGYSSTGVGSSNCITATIGVDSSSRRTEITLSGLSFFRSASSNTFPLHINQAACSAGTAATATFPGGFETTGKWDSEKGTLRVSLANGHFLVAGQVASFTFKTTNQGNPTSAKLTLSIQGWYCRGAAMCADGKEFSGSSDVISRYIVTRRSGENLRQVVTTGPSFDTRKIHQSTSDPGATATITVTLKPNTAVSLGSEITLTGLCGTILNSNPAITAGSVSVKSWDRSTAKLVLTTTAQLNANADSVLKWDWVLVGTTNSRCDVQISASGSSLFASQTMENVGGTLGLVAGPGFTTYEIGQYSTRPGALNYICITLTSNVDVKKDSSITLSGFAGTQTTDLIAADIYDCPTTLLANGAVPAKKTDGLMLSPSRKTANTFDFSSTYPHKASVVLGADFVKGIQYSFAFQFRNGIQDSACKQISLELKGTLDQQLSMRVSATARAIEDGNVDGDVCVLKTYKAGFLVAHISQSIFTGGEANTLTVSLKTNFDLTGSTVGYTGMLIITGLKGAKDRSGKKTLQELSVSSVGTNMFPGFSSADWKQENGELKLATSSSGIKAGQVYVFSFKLFNGDVAQAAQQISISADYALGSSTPLLKMDTPTSEEFQPMYIIAKDQLLYKYKIGQKWPAQKARNAICVTLGFAKDVAGAVSVQRFTSITISGLKGYATGSQTLDLLGSDGRSLIDATSASYDIFGAEYNKDKNKARWDESAGSLTLIVVKEAKKMTQYPFCFPLTNPDKEVACPDLKIETRSEGKSSSVTMTQDKTTVIQDYPVGSACAGYTAQRAFSRARIRASTNVTGSEAYMIAELVTNYEIKEFDTITISGLKGYSAGFTSQVHVSNNGLSEDLFGSSSLGSTVVFSMAKGMSMKAQNSLQDSTLIERVYELTFPLTNGNSAQNAPVIYIEASNGISRQIMQSGRPEDPLVATSLGQKGGGSGSGSSSVNLVAALVGSLVPAFVLGMAGATFYLYKKGMLQNPFGKPSLDLSTEEQLRVFYMRYAPKEIKDIKGILKAYKSEDALNKALKDKYGADLTSLRTPLPTQPAVATMAPSRPPMIFPAVPPPSLGIMNTPMMSRMPLHGPVLPR